MNPLFRTAAIAPLVLISIAVADVAVANPDKGFPKSADVHDDGSVTFRVIATKAEQVEVRGSFLAKGEKSLPMKKNEKGVWEATTEPLQPEVYSYSFRVDETYVLDPHNRWYKGWRRSANLFLVPGKPALIWERQNVPQGVVHQHSIWSDELKMHRELYVYTPPGYEDSDQSLPVLYLLHGSGDDASAWTRVGLANVIADNLIASGKMKPMVIVMPHGHAPSKDHDAIANNEAWWEMNNQRVMGSFFRDYVPFVKANYRVSTLPEQNAIAGLSMGGGQALQFGMTHPEMFRSVLAYSAGTPDSRKKIDQRFAGVTPDSKIKRLWIACGKDDFLLKRNKMFLEWLDAKGIDYQWTLTEGGHSWPVWRAYLSESLPLLFQD